MTRHRKFYGRLGSCYVVDEFSPSRCENKARIVFHKTVLVCQKHYAQLLRAAGDGGDWARSQ